jgi:hypothetical protein
MNQSLPQSSSRIRRRPLRRLGRPTGRPVERSASPTAIGEPTTPRWLREERYERDAIREALGGRRLAWDPSAPVDTLPPYFTHLLRGAARTLRLDVAEGARRTAPVPAIVRRALAAECDQVVAEALGRIARGEDWSGWEFIDRSLRDFLFEHAVQAGEPLVLLTFRDHLAASGRSVPPVSVLTRALVRRLAELSAEPDPDVHGGPDGARNGEFKRLS